MCIRDRRLSVGLVGLIVVVLEGVGAIVLVVAVVKGVMIKVFVVVVIEGGSTAAHRKINPPLTPFSSL